jgi:ribonucleoside-diphosphate reductase beta chain
MKTTPIFDSTALDSGNDIWNGKTTNLMLLNNPRYKWAHSMYKKMRDDFWIPQKVDLTADITDYTELTDSERKAFNGVLSYLIYLDSIQEAMLPALGETMTAPDVRHCLAEQCYFEGIHSESYKYIVESLLPVEQQSIIYDYWRTDNVLKKRCEFILDYYQRYLDSRSGEDYFYALFADYLLEGLYFYNGFIFFYTLSSRQRMNGCADIIKYINRDEQSHVRLFQRLITEAMPEFEYSKEKIMEMVDDAVNQEIDWANHITNNEVLGISETSTEQYTKYLADLRLKAIGLEPIYGSAKSPYKHLEKIADIGGEAGTKSNFFETSVTSYNMSTVIQGWDF